MSAPATINRPKIAIASLVSLLLLIVIVFQPLVMRLAQSAARERGFTIEVGRVRAGTRGLWLLDIQASRPSVPGFKITLQAVRLPWTQLVSREQLFVTGGTVSLPENLKLLHDDLSANQRAGNATRPLHQAQLFLTGLTVNWSGAKPDANLFSAWGVSGVLMSDTVRLTVDRIEATHDDLFGQLGAIALDLNHTKFHWELDKLTAQSANIELRSPGSSPAGPARGSRLIQKRGTLPVETDAIAATVPNDAIEHYVDILSSVKRYTKAVREAALERIATPGTVDIPQLSFRWFHAGQKLDIGPLRVQALRDSDQIKIALEQSSGGGEDRRYVELRIPVAPSRIELSSEIGFVSLQSLGVKEADLGLSHVDAAKIRLSMKSAIDEEASDASITAAGEVLDLSLRQPWLASRAVEGINGSFSGSGTVSWKSDYVLKISDLSLIVGQARLNVTADIRRTASETRADIGMNMPLAACEGLIESLPVGLAPLASQVRLDGTLALQAAIRFDTAHPAQTDAKWELANGCRVRGASPLVAPERFREPFILEVPDAQGKMMERAFGPGTVNWVPLPAMTSLLSDAILVCEDGRFFHHNGFDSQAIRSSIRDNLLRGRFLRGGSTVSMQLAKNLYLRREKTFSRKLQEAALTLLLEQSFTKNEIMELYLNVVELGPGIYGVGEASQFYFGTAPAALSPAQAFYLASILPNPKAMHFTADGRVSVGWLKQVRRLLTIAHSRHYLTDEELRLGLNEELRFGVAAENSTAVIDQTPGAVENGAEGAQERPEHE
jgi:hypothetical protein